MGSFDMWYIFLGLFIIAIAEGKRLEDTAEDAFTGFSLLFEIVSAYGTVGLSLGHPEVNTSLSGKFTVVSKLVIIAMQVRGRHRGLPYKLDRAILLPGDMLNQEDFPPAGGVLLLVMEHKSDYVRFHAWQSSLLFSAMFVLHPIFSWSSFLSWVIFIADLGMIGYLTMRAYRDADTLDRCEVPFFGRLASSILDDE